MVLGSRIQFLLSGTLSLLVEPNTDWFFNSIPPEAGNGQLEKKSVQVASYGRQFGLITEVLLPLTGADAVDRAKARNSLERLQKIYLDIEYEKAKSKTQIAESATALLEKLRSIDPDELARIIDKFRS